MDDGSWYGILRKGFNGGEIMASISERLDAMEAEIRKPRFRESTGMANEVNYWVFDYPPEKELEVRERMSIFTISAWQRRKYILTSREAHP